VIGMQIIEYDSEFRVNIDFNYLRKRNTAAVQKIPGSRFDWTEKNWIVPKHQRSALIRLQKYAGAEYYRVNSSTPEQMGKIEPLPELDMDVPLSHPEGF